MGYLYTEHVHNPLAFQGLYFLFREVIFLPIARSQFRDWKENGTRVVAVFHEFRATLIVFDYKSNGQTYTIKFENVFPDSEMKCLNDGDSVDIVVAYLKGITASYLETRIQECRFSWSRCICSLLLGVMFVGLTLLYCFAVGFLYSFWSTDFSAFVGCWLLSYTAMFALQVLSQGFEMSRWEYFVSCEVDNEEKA